MHLGWLLKPPVIRGLSVDARLSVEPRFWTGLGHLGQVLPVSRPTCSVVGSRINLVPVNHVLLMSRPTGTAQYYFWEA